jgi:hypothetical protein
MTADESSHMRLVFYEVKPMAHDLPESFTLLDSAEARAALRVSDSTLQRMVKQGRLHRSSASVGRALFSLGEIRRVISTPLVQQNQGATRG